MTRRRRPANNGHADSTFAGPLIAVSPFAIRFWPARKTPFPGRGQSRQAERGRARAACVCPVPNCESSRPERQAGSRIPAASGGRGGEDRGPPEQPPPPRERRNNRPERLEAATRPLQGRAETPAHPAIRRSVRPLSAAGASCSTRFQPRTPRKNPESISTWRNDSPRCALRLD